MGRASLIMVLGFIFVFGLVRSNLNEAGDNITEGVYDYYRKTVALNIANSLGMTAIRLLAVQNDWSQWVGDYADVSMLSGRGRLVISNADPDLLPGELSINTRGVSGDFGRRARIVVVPSSLMPDAQGALGVVGEDTDQIFDGLDFEINGNDVNPDGSPGANPPVPGISVSSPVTEESLVDELNAEGSDSLVIGEGGGTPNVQLMSEPLDISGIAAAIGEKATMTYGPQPGEYFFFGTPVQWGTPSNPEIVYLQDDVNVFGSLQGAGILIVDEQLDINGDFRWEGLVLVTKNGFLNHALDVTGGTGEIYGSMLVEAETGSPELEVAGDLKLQYSSMTLEQLPAMLNLLTYAVKNWEEW